MSPAPLDLTTLAQAIEDATPEQLLALLPALSALHHMAASRLHLETGIGLGARNVRARASGERLITPEAAAERIGRDRKWIDRRRHVLPWVRERDSGRGYDVIESILEEWIRTRGK